jgi:hypothetical protein
MEPKPTTPKPQPSPPSQQRESHATVWGGVVNIRGGR